MIENPKKHAPVFVETKVGDEVIVMHLDSGEFFSLRGTAAQIWLLIDNERSLSEIVAVLAKEHGAPESAVSPDVEEFIKQLGQAGLLEQ